MHSRIQQANWLPWKCSPHEKAATMPQRLKKKNYNNPRVKKLKKYSENYFSSI